MANNICKQIDILNEFVDDFEKKYDICIDEFERKPKEEK